MYSCVDILRGWEIGTYGKYYEQIQHTRNVWTTFACGKPETPNNILNM